MVTPEAINEMLEAEWPEAICRCVELSSTHAVARLAPEPEMVRPGGMISGPTLFAAADAALWFLVFGALGAIEVRALTSDLSIRFLRPAEGEVIYARATLDKAGRRSVVGTVSLWTDSNDELPSATAQGTYLLPGGTAAR